MEAYVWEEIRKEKKLIVKMDVDAENTECGDTLSSLRCRFHLSS